MKKQGHKALRVLPGLSIVQTTYLSLTYLRGYDMSKARYAEIACGVAAGLAAIATVVLYYIGLSMGLAAIGTMYEVAGPIMLLSCPTLILLGQVFRHIDHGKSLKTFFSE